MVNERGLYSCCFTPLASQFTAPTAFLPIHDIGLTGPSDPDPNLDANSTENVGLKLYGTLCIRICRVCCRSTTLRIVSLSVTAVSYTTVNVRVTQLTSAAGTWLISKSPSDVAFCHKEFFTSNLAYLHSKDSFP
jgi:hypothetical protein